MDETFPTEPGFYRSRSKFAMEYLEEEGAELNPYLLGTDGFWYEISRVDGDPFVFDEEDMVEWLPLERIDT